MDLSLECGDLYHRLVGCDLSQPPDSVSRHEAAPRPPQEKAVTGHRTPKVTALQISSKVVIKSHALGN